MIKIDEKTKGEIIDLSISLVVTFAMLVYGIGKTVQFGDGSIPTNGLEMSDGMAKMWAFYGHSKPFALIIGALEVIGGLLLLFPRARLIGCLLLTTVLSNIILQDYFYDVHRGALAAAIWYQFLICILLFRHKDTLIAAFKSLTLRSSELSSSMPFYLKFLLAFLAFVALRLFEQMLIGAV